MGYNKYRWWTKGKRHKPLKYEAPLLLKIRNGDFEYSEMFEEADEMRKAQNEIYNQTYDNYGGSDERNRIEVALDASRMVKLKALKLEMEASKSEEHILWKLRTELKKEFEKDLWDVAMQDNPCTTEELYFWYKKMCNQGTTKSEIDIQLKRPNTIGLEYLFI